uniref:CCR4-NOT transcription complex subunit 1 domain-containing protein n=1 Tax=Panagrolaimus davidi TaxID=227884 RepID=A0A914PWX6_9BILA
MQPNIKLAIKFEFEVLCQHLNVPLRCVLPAYSYLPHENAASVESQNPMIFFPIYDYNEINIHDQIDMHFDIPIELPLFHIFPALSCYCRKAISDAIRENMDEMVKRAGAAAILLTEDLINKDFAFCPDPQQMRIAYLFMVRSLTSGAGMVTSKEPLTTSIIGHLRRLIQHQLELSGDNDPDLARMADATMVHILEKNIELACCYVVKTAYAVQRRRNGLKLEISPEIQAIIDSIPQELRPINGPFDEDTFEVYKTFGSQIIGFKFTGLIDPIVNHLPPPENYCQEPFQYPVVSASQFRERAELIFADWTKFCAYSCFAPPPIVGPYLAGLMEKYFLPINDQYMIRFLKAALDICTNVSYELLSSTDKTFGSVTYSRSSSCYTVDAFAKLAWFVSLFTIF